MPFQMSGEGFAVANGMGLLLFVDGRPQPYRTAEDETYRYMHFFPNITPDFVADVYFVPVTGEKGDVLEIYATNIMDPNHDFANGYYGFIYTMGSTVYTTRLKFLADLPAERPEVTNSRITSLNTTHVTTRYSDIGDWSEKELLYKNDARTYINGQKPLGNMIYDITPDEPITVKFEIWGSSLVDCGLVIYVDNEPVFYNGDIFIPLEMQSGKTTVVEAEVQIPDFDNNSVVYVYYVARNYWENLDITACCETTGHFFLIAGPKPEA